MASTVTNSTVNTAAAAVPAPYGPLTRVSNVADTAPNSHIDIEFTSSVGTTTVFMSYDELIVPAIRDRILANAHAGRGLNHAMYEASLVVKALNAYMESYAFPPATDAETQLIIDGFRTIRLFTGGMPNIDLNIENKVVADFAIVDGGSQEGDVDDDSTGDILFKFWDWGDGTTSVGNQTVHDFVSAGTYDVTLIVVGRGSVSTQTNSVVIA